MAEDVKCSLATRNKQAGTRHPPEQMPFPGQPPPAAAAPQPGELGLGFQTMQFGSPWSQRLRNCDGLRGGRCREQGWRQLHRRGSCGEGRWRPLFRGDAQGQSGWEGALALLQEGAGGDKKWFVFSSGWLLPIANVNASEEGGTRHSVEGNFWNNLPMGIFAPLPFILVCYESFSLKKLYCFSLLM